MDRNLAAEQNIFVINHKSEKNILQSDVERLSKTHWLCDYARDIFQTMREQELRRLPMFFLSPQSGERHKMLQLLQLAARTHKLSRCALHLAVYYMDRFVDHYKIRSDKLFLVAITCLHIAAQIENTEAFIPRYSDMNRLVRNAYTAFEYKAVERKMLCFLNFELLRPTTASFVELFACSFLTRSDFAAYIDMLDECERHQNIQLYRRFGSFEQMLATLAQSLLRMADYTLNISRFSNDAPSLLAAACIAAVRQVHGVKRWSSYLTELTSYTEANVEPYMDVLTDFHYFQTIQTVWNGTNGQNNQNLSSPDSGFEESLTDRTELVVSEEVVTVEVETYNIVTVQLQDRTPDSTTTPIKNQTNLKRPRSEDNLDNLENPRPIKQAKTEENES
ncbi:cyclin-J [Drosophila eugracilis]|uniref:cyclin-J n=1 Tax=Drosophila eugracilis TaxID=29029 RepID=UPI0007E7E869|nr:cyclin-J [Drosophila eugracilis]